MLNLLLSTRRWEILIIWFRLMEFLLHHGWESWTLLVSIFIFFCSICGTEEYVLTCGCISATDCSYWWVITPLFYVNLWQVFCWFRRRKSFPCFWQHLKTFQIWESWLFRNWNVFSVIREQQVFANLLNRRYATFPTVAVSFALGILWWLGHLSYFFKMKNGLNFHIIFLSWIEILLLEENVCVIKVNNRVFIILICKRSELLPLIIFWINCRFVI